MCALNDELVIPNREQVGLLALDVYHGICQVATSAVKTFQAMEVDSSERCIIKLLPSRERLTDTYMTDKLADKVWLIGIADDGQMSFTPQCLACLQVEYMEGRLLDFNAALTAAEGCSVDHPVHVAMQVIPQYKFSGHMV